MGWQAHAPCQIPVGCCSRIDAVGDLIAEWCDRAGTLARGFLSGRLLLGQPSLVPLEPSLQDGDGVAEVITERDKEVDIVEIFLAAEAVSEVVARVDGGLHFATVVAEEAVVASAHFGGRPVGAEGGDGDGHGQVVAKTA